jgi:hypothetical protein
MIKSARLTGSAYKKGFWKTQLRPFIFIFVFVFVFTFVFAYRAHIYYQYSTYQASGEAWVSCMLLTGSSIAACGVKPEQTPSVGLWFMIQLAIGGQGVLNSVIFGTQATNYYLWKGFLMGKGRAYTGKSAGATGEDSTPDHSKSGPSAATSNNNKSSANKSSANKLSTNKSDKSGTVSAAHRVTPRHTRSRSRAHSCCRDSPFSFALFETACLCLCAVSSDRSRSSCSCGRRDLESSR